MVATSGIDAKRDWRKVYCPHQGGHGENPNSHSIFHLFHGGRAVLDGVRR
jgi:hypothetical protein